MAENFDAAIVEAAAILVSVLGRKRALAVLESERPSRRGYGFGGGITAIRNKFWEAIPTSTPDVEAEALLARLDATSLLRAGRAQDFDEIIEEVYAAIVSGAAEARVAEERKAAQDVTAGKFDPPVVPNSDDPVADLQALESWKEALEAWHETLTVEVAKKFPKQPWQMYDEAKEVMLKRVQAWLVEQMRNAPDVGAAKAIVAKVKIQISGEVIRKSIAACPWAWDLVLADEYLVQTWDLDKLPVPSPEALARIPESKILDWARHGLGWCDAELLRRYPTAAGQVTIVGKFRILPDGKVEEQIYEIPVEAQRKPLATVPSAQGWLDLKEGRFFDPKFYEIYQRLQKARRGAVRVGITSKFNRHEQKGYPRFSFAVSSGSAHASFELPVWRSQQGEGWLAQRFDDIKAFEDWSLTVPEDAYWLDVQIGQTAKGNPRLEPIQSGQPSVPAVLVYNESSAMRHGRHGWDEIPPVAKEANGGARIVWSASPQTAGLYHHAELLWIPKSGSITLDSGAVLTFNGEKVVTSARAKDDPSREG